MNDFCPKDCPNLEPLMKKALNEKGAWIWKDIKNSCIHEAACQMWQEKIKINEKEKDTKNGSNTWNDENSII